MKQESIEIDTGAGVSRGVVFRHDEPRTGVLHLTDVGGIRPAHLDLARRVAEQGYCVLVPNVFHRTSEPPVFDFPRVLGEPRTMARIAELAAPLTPEVMRRDAAAYVDALLADEGTRGDAVGVVGHCITGKMALLAAAERPEAVGAAVSLHGGHLVTGDADSPHRALPAVRARLYFAHATDDPQMPADAIATLEQALAAWGGHFASETYPAAHGWTAADGAAYDQAEAERARARLLATLGELP